jgi:hypothetical protein
MGLFDFLKKGSTPPPAKGATPLSKKVAGPAKLVSDKRAQAYDRSEAIRQLAELETAEAAEALLKRFTFTIDPSITDQEEKEAAYEGVVRVGEAAVPPVLAFCQRAEVLTWPLRMLRAILSDDAYKAELLGLAESFDTEYSRNVEPKLQVVAALEEVAGEDVNETVRFHAVQSTFAQAQKQSADALVRLLESEESVRIKNKICEGFILKEWAVPNELVDQAKKAMSDVSDFRLRDDGKFSRR